MRRIVTLWPALVALLLAATATADSGGVYDLTLTELQPGIYVLQRPDVFRQPVEPNALVIVNAHDVVVVDAGGSPRSAENAIRLIRGVTKNPVSVLVNTHWHGDHNLGNDTYRKAFPGIQIVAHANTVRAMTGKPMEYVQRYGPMLTGVVADMEKRAADGKLSAAGQTALPDFRAMRDEYLRVKVSPPDTAISCCMTLLRGARTIEIEYLGRGNTEGDLVVWLPNERLLASGDLVVAPVPYGFGSFPAQWLATLDKLAAFDFATLVPGHGPLMHDRAALRYEQALLRAVRTQVELAVAQGLDLAATRKAVNLAELAEQATGGDPKLEALFKAWWTDPIVRSAWLEARGEPIVQGASDETG